MKELRCLAFNDQEVALAIMERRRRLREPLPEGTIQKVSYTNENGIAVQISAATESGQESAITAHDSEVSAALVNYCVSRKIPMPVDADKYVQVIGDGLTLMITMRFNKSHKGSDDHKSGTASRGRL